MSYNLSGNVEAGFEPAGEGGFQPRKLSGQDAAFTGSQDGCRHVFRYILG